MTLCALLPWLIGIGSALLGGLIGWYLRNPRFLALQSELDDRIHDYHRLEGTHTQLQGEYTGLQALYSDLDVSREDYKNRLQIRTKEYNSLSLTHSSLQTEYDGYKVAVDGQAANLRTTASDWEAKYHDLLARLNQLESAIQDKDRINAQLNADLEACRQKGADWSLKFGNLKSEYDALTVAQSNLTTQLDYVNAKWEGHLAAAQAQNQDLQAQYDALALEIDDLQSKVDTVQPTAPKRGAKEDVLLRVAAKKGQINFDRIGLASAADKDELQRIKGIGPFIESKLHALDIYTFHQISRFTPEDEEKVNLAIEFFPGRIHRDGWARQAKDLHEAKQRGELTSTTPIPGAIFSKYQPDDLKIVEGIGPKIEGLLHDANIKTWSKLAQTTVKKLQEILTAAGDRYRIHNPATWPKQAELAADAKWKELEEYQEFLVGGRDFSK